MNNINDKLPIYNLTFNSDELQSGILAISLVDQPAIEINWFSFSKEIETKIEFKSINTDKQILAGYFLVPDKLIYRKDEKTNFEYYVKFNTDTVNALAEKFNMNLLSDKFNINHNSNNTTRAFVKENWIVENAEFDKSKMYGFEPIVGGWFGLVKVQDNALWNEFIKSGKLNGFSIEGLFTMEIEKLMKENLNAHKKNAKTEYLKMVKAKANKRKNIIRNYLKRVTQKQTR